MAESGVPRPENSRSDGQQGEADAEEVRALSHSSGLAHSNHFGEVLEGVSEIRGSAAMLLTTAGFKQLSSDILDLQRRLATAEAARDSWRERYHEQNTRRTVLEAQLRTRSFLERIQNVALAVGGVVAGLGFSMVQTGTDQSTGGILAAVGLVSMGIGAVRPGKES